MADTITLRAERMGNLISQHMGNLSHLSTQNITNIVELPVFKEYGWVTAVTLCLSIIFGALAISRTLSGHKQWIRVGQAPGLFGRNLKSAKADFAKNGRAMVRDGYRKYKDQNFVVQSVNNEQLIVSPKFLPELRMLPETKLSHAQILSDYWVGEHIGADQAMEGAQHIDAVRGPLTRSLKTIVPVMHREYRATSEALFSQVPKETREMNAFNFCYATVSRITSTVFMGEELARAGGWDKIVMEYFPEAWRVRCALWYWPRWMRPIVKPFVVGSNQLEAILAKAETYLEEPIRRRRDPDNADVDILKFLSEYNESPRKVALQIVGIVTGALNTSTHALTEAVYDLCARPALVEEIRDEANKALTSTGGQWTLSTLKKLHLLDSTLKESLRLFAPEGLAVTRVATSSFTLSDGTHVPKGTNIAVAGEAMALDPDFYPSPTTFDARRFLGKDGLPLAPEREFHGIEPGNGMWGHGRLTCPGRHYASALSKLIIANLVLRYDISFPGGQTTKPVGTEDDANYLPDMTQNIVIRERELA